MHQIDVDVTLRATRKRILIECRDREDAVNLSHARDFKGVLTQLQPDEAFIVAKDGFTRPAETYATEEGIRLAVLRGFEDKDWEGRLRNINVEMRWHSRGEPKITGWIWKDEDEQRRLQQLLSGVEVNERLSADEVFFYDASGNREATFRKVLISRLISLLSTLPSIGRELC